MFLPLLGERAGVRGNRTPAVLAASALDSAPENRPKSHMALSHSSLQASGFAGGRRQLLPCIAGVAVRRLNCGVWSSGENEVIILHSTENYFGSHFSQFLANASTFSR